MDLLPSSVNLLSGKCSLDSWLGVQFLRTFGLIRASFLKVFIPRQFEGKKTIQYITVCDPIDLIGGKN